MGLLRPIPVNKTIIVTFSILKKTKDHSGLFLSSIVICLKDHLSVWKVAWVSLGPGDSAEAEDGPRVKRISLHGNTL